MGIEPTTGAWEATVLPLYHGRDDRGDWRQALQLIITSKKRFASAFLTRDDVLSEIRRAISRDPPLVLFEPKGKMSKVYAGSNALTN